MASASGRLMPTSKRKELPVNDEIMTVIRAYGRAELAAGRLAAEIQASLDSVNQLEAELDDTRAEVIRFRGELLKLARQDAVAAELAK